MQLRSSKEMESTRKYWFILLVYILLILIGFIISGQIYWTLYAIIFSIIVIFTSLVFWQEYILPDLGLSKHLSLAKNILINQFIKSSLILSIRNGDIEGDYPLLKKKPDVKVIKIDQKSAVLIESASKKKSLLFYGIHVLSKNLKIIGVFYLGLRSINIGPDNKNGLAPIFSHESLVDYHSRINSAEKTKTQLLSGESIYPSFSIFYRIDSTGDYEKDLDLILNISKKLNRGNSSLITPRGLDKYLINEFLNNWNSFCENKNREEILAVIPNSFDLTEIRDCGIKSQIFLDQIY